VKFSVTVILILISSVSTHKYCISWDVKGQVQVNLTVLQMDHHHMMDHVHDSTTTPHHHGGTDDHHGVTDDHHGGTHDGHTMDECSSMDSHSMMMVRGYCNDTTRCLSCALVAVVVVVERWVNLVNLKETTIWETISRLRWFLQMQGMEWINCIVITFSSTSV
jgi:hypothetical protein